MHLIKYCIYALAIFQTYWVNFCLPQDFYRPAGVQRQLYPLIYWYIHKTFIFSQYKIASYQLCGHSYLPRHTIDHYTIQKMLFMRIKT